MFACYLNDEVKTQEKNDTPLTNQPPQLQDKKLLDQLKQQPEQNNVQIEKTQKDSNTDKKRSLSAYSYTVQDNNTYNRPKVESKVGDVNCQAIPRQGEIFSECDQVQYAQRREDDMGFMKPVYNAFKNITNFGTNVYESTLYTGMKASNDLSRTNQMIAQDQIRVNNAIQKQNLRSDTELDKVALQEQQKLQQAEEEYNYAGNSSNPYMEIENQRNGIDYSITKKIV